LQLWETPSPETAFAAGSDVAWGSFDYFNQPALHSRNSSAIMRISRNNQELSEMRKHFASVVYNWRVVP
jgi:hypothetical protein